MMLTVLVTGGHDYNDEQALYDVLDRVTNIDGPLTIIQGGATGADAIARR